MRLSFNGPPCSYTNSRETSARPLRPAAARRRQRILAPVYFSTSRGPREPLNARQKRREGPRSGFFLCRSAPHPSFGNTTYMRRNRADRLSCIYPQFTITGRLIGALDAGSAASICSLLIFYFFFRRGKSVFFFFFFGFFLFCCVQENRGIVLRARGGCRRCPAWPASIDFRVGIY